MNKLKTIAIALGCAAVATATVATFGAKPLPFQPAQATEKTFCYDKTVGDTWADGATFVSQKRNVPTGKGDPITTTVNGKTGNSTGGFGGSNFFQTNDNVGEPGEVTFEAGLNNVTSFACEFHVNFAALAENPRFFLNITATDGEHESKLEVPETKAAVNTPYFYRWTKSPEEAAFKFTSIKMAIGFGIDNAHDYFVCFFHYAEVTWNC